MPTGFSGKVHIESSCNVKQQDRPVPRRAIVPLSRHCLLCASWIHVSQEHNPNVHTSDQKFSLPQATKHKPTSNPALAPLTSSLRNLVEKCSWQVQDPRMSHRCAVRPSWITPSMMDLDRFVTNSLLEPVARSLTHDVNERALLAIGVLLRWTMMQAHLIPCS